MNILYNDMNESSFEGNVEHFIPLMYFLTTTVAKQTNKQFNVLN